MVKLSPGKKKALQSIIGISKTAFHWGFLPFVIYLGKINLTNFFSISVQEINCHLVESKVRKQIFFVKI